MSGTVVDQIAGDHGGFVEFTEKEGAGTTCSVFIPSIAASVGADPRRGGGVRGGSGELLLVVDDEETIRRLMVGALEKAGYRAIAASDGARAVEVFSENRREIAAVLMDLELPVMGGVAAIRAVRELEPECPIVALTGRAEGMRRSGQLGEGGVSFLCKPFTPSVLVRTVRDALNG